jgi:hypothetical protein
VFRGVADNRLGVLGHARVLLMAGYGVVMMDARTRWRRPSIHVISSHLASQWARELCCNRLRSNHESRQWWRRRRLASLREASYDYAGLRRSPLLRKTLFAPGALTMIWHAERLAGLPALEVSPEKGGRRPSVSGISDLRWGDIALPCRHIQNIFNAARGPKQMWLVPGAYHTAALDYEPQEFRRRVLAFLILSDSASRQRRLRRPSLPAGCGRLHACRRGNVRRPLRGCGEEFRSGAARDTYARTRRGGACRTRRHRRSSLQ